MNRRTGLFALFAIIGSVMLLSCATSRNEKKTENMNDESAPMVGVPSPPAIVYKTKEDYNKLVPVILSPDKSRIVSFPAQSDIRVNDSFSYPDELAGGYLLDNRGISQHATFLRFTYEDYYNMDNIPTAERMINYIIDDDPFVEMYEVGRRGDFRNPVEEINAIITSGRLTEKKNLLTQ